MASVAFDPIPAGTSVANDTGHMQAPHGAAIPRPGDSEFGRESSDPLAPHFADAAAAAAPLPDRRARQAPAKGLVLGLMLGAAAWAVFGAVFLLLR